MNAQAGMLDLRREIRLLLQIAMVIFVYTIIVGILNGTDAVDFQHRTLLTHVHAGTLGWITISAIAAGMWLFGHEKPGPASHQSMARAIALLAPVLIIAYVIAFLRTIPPVGEPTPLPPAGFEAAVTARLPDDYWRTLKEGEKRGYHNAAEEVAYFAANQPADLGPQLARGRMIASSICSACHGAALDGVGEPSGDTQGALAYDDAAFDRLLIESIDRTGKKVTMEFGFGHEATQLSAAERRDVIAYVRALAGSRKR